MLMRPDTAIRRLQALGTISKQGKRINGLFRLVTTPLLWYEAYANIYSNKGAMTPGVDQSTFDGFSEERVNSIITRLKEGSYRFQPARRIHIPKANGKKRPLGISSADDKLVQEVVRSILEKIYEPIFEDNSHGFRPARSPHTALATIQRRWTAVKWIIDMDIRSYFDTIQHDLLLHLLTKKIDDSRFMRLIKAMLEAGYMEDWKFQVTYSGVPQGSIVSPLLANVYLHELDQFMKTLKEGFESGRKRKGNPAYLSSSYQISRLRKKWDALKRKEGKEQEIQGIRQSIQAFQRLQKAVPSGNPFDKEYKRLYYCRYADDYVIGIIGSKADAESVREQVKQFIQETLRLTIAEEKSHIQHSKMGVIFAGYWIKTHSGDRIVRTKRNGRYTTMKSVSERMQLHIPPGKLQKFCQNKRYGNYQTMEAKHRPELLHLSDAEIILTYNAEFHGLANYYALTCHVKSHLAKLGHVWTSSLFKTLAAKHKRSVSKIAKQLKTDDGYALTIRQREETRRIKIFRLKDLKIPEQDDRNIDPLPNTFALTLSRSELIRRLNTEKCEYCETREGPFQVHHIRKLKDVAQGKQLWQQMMAARHRKTLVLCLSCHRSLHAGTLPHKRERTRQVNGEPDALKGASPVRGEGDA
jgi:group II intron reverse transcriptase/maturase